MIHLPFLVVLAGTVAAAVTDLRSFRISNRLTFPLLGAGLLYQGSFGGWEGLTASVAGVLLGFGVLSVPYLIGAIGAGDVKLIMAFGAWLGPRVTLLVLGVGLASTAAYSVVLLYRQGRLRQAWITWQLALHKLHSGSLGDESVQLERVQDVARQLDRHRRLIPFSIMAGWGVVAAILFE